MTLQLPPDISKLEYLDFYSYFQILSFSPPKVLVTLHLPRGGTMSSRPRRNFRNMGFHFLTPIFHFLSKPEPNPKLVAYSMITHTWTRKTHFDKIPKNFLRQNSKTQLSLSKLNFDKKYWLNFWKLPFSSWHPRSKTGTDLPYESIFLLPRYPASVCIWPELIPTPESDFIHLPASCTILAHFLSTVGWQLERGALGYPTRVERGG